jgi:hypothetical protein
MTIPKRFALSTLLLVMLLVSLVFGYAQWRRQRLISEAQSLAAEGVYLTNFRTGWFWPTAGDKAHVFTFGLGKAEIGEIAERLASLGITRIRWDKNKEPGK